MSTDQQPINKSNSIIGSLLELFRRPFPVMEDWEMRWLVIAFHGVFVATFLILFRPFQNIFTSANPFIIAGYGLIVSAVLAINHFLISKVLPVEIKKWTIGKSILWTLFDVVSVIVAVFVYNNYWTNFENFTWKELINIGSVTLLISIIPVMISTILLENWLLRRNLKKASQLQQSVDNAAAVAPVKVVNQGEDLLTLYAENQSEWIKIRPSSLIYLESTDNYVSLYYKEKDQIQKKLLRSTLTKIENQIQPAYIQRCHRSYMLNLHQIQYVNGNSRGLQLQLLDMEKVIPVSRKYVKGILAQIEENK